MTASITARTDPIVRLAKKYILVMFWLLLNVAYAAGADKDMSPEYAACIDKSNGVTNDMLDCISAETTRQDARLNENYKKLMSKLPAKRREALLEAQRAWVKFRDANCGYYYDPDGGSAAHLAGVDCVLSATADRATELKNLTNDE